MEAFLKYWLRWPSVEHLFQHNAWAWPLCETMHFVGIILLVGIVGMFDLRLLGFARAIPLAPLRRLLPWGVLGFALAAITGLLFVTGIYANVEIPPYTVAMNDGFLQLKLLFMALAGLNLLAFYATGAARDVEHLGAGEDAPPKAKLNAGLSLVFWLLVVYFGRLIPWGSFAPPSALR